MAFNLVTYDVVSMSIFELESLIKSPGGLNVVPKTSSAGVHDRSSLTVLRIANKITGRCSDQLCGVVAMIDAFNCRWNRSTKPLDAG